MITFDEFGFVVSPGEYMPFALKERIDAKYDKGTKITIVSVDANGHGFVQVLVQVGDKV
jgi:hypothetical protein